MSLGRELGNLGLVTRQALSRIPTVLTEEGQETQCRASEEGHP